MISRVGVLEVQKYDSSLWLLANCWVPRASVSVASC